MQYTYITTGHSITVYLQGNQYTAEKTHPNWDSIIEKVKQGNTSRDDERDLINLFDFSQAIRKFLGDSISISDDGVLTYKDMVIDNTLTRKIVRMLEEKFDIEPMLNFLINLNNNPSEYSKQELMLFMEVNEMPLTPDGYLLAYKSVNSSYKDIHSGKFDNSVGSICEMPREKVDNNRSQTCSSGLHFAAKEYAAGFGGSSSKLMVLKINPADVVSIPNDYNNQKGRCCKYEVIDEVRHSIDDPDKYNTVAVTDDKDKPTCSSCQADIQAIDQEMGVCGCCGEVI